MDFIRSAVGLSVVLIGVYIGLYCLVLVEGRYVWPVMVLSWLVAMSLIVRLGRTFRRGSMLVSTLLVVVSILVLIDPVGLRSSTIQTRGATSLVNMSSELDLADELMDLEVIPDAPGPVASNGQWDNSMYFSYYHDTEYYGLLRSGATDAENRRALADSRIEWFLLWGKDTSVPAYLMDYTLAAVALDGDLRVFRRR